MSEEKREPSQVVSVVVQEDGNTTLHVKDGNATFSQILGLLQYGIMLVSTEWQASQAAQKEAEAKKENVIPK